MNVSVVKVILGSLSPFNRKEYEKNRPNQAHRNYNKYLSQHGQRRIYINEKLRKNM